MTMTPRYQPVLLLLCVAWVLVAFVATEVVTVAESATGTSPQAHDDSCINIPTDFDAPFGSYPNLLDISPDERKGFSKVVAQINPVVHDHSTAQGLASLDEIEMVRRRYQRPTHKLWKAIQRRISVMGLFMPSWLPKTESKKTSCFDIGKYDENRVAMYSSSHFQDTTNQIDGFGGQRTVHLGIDLGAPVGTPCRAFADGIVHSVGYNADHGDYGYVIVVEHVWGPSSPSNNGTDTKHGNTATERKRVWALYGHLDHSTTCGGRRQPGDVVRRGQILGRIGDVHENGGWLQPHVHFQLSLQPPQQPHDMPGASSVEDRMTALKFYPDPRWVLGELY